ncbi:hypothetical protein [Arsukibacterium perlucidum]|uniref:hypothetical protein n=1 Tax=Arsukibacterium perlucidum TaxID=368811 RepID=UPI000374F5C4|nr:hypothetical protein [Arsukibacterium perlucidum]
MDFDQNKYKVWKLPNPLLLHWVINPGLAFNELVLGQRIPKITLIDKTSDAPLIEKQYVPCPHCHTIHDARLWGKQGAFKNWFGYLCPQCDEVIPCLWNLTSLLLLALTFPIWGWFRKPLKAKWKSYKKNEQLANKDTELVKAKDISGIKMGLTFGALMFCVMSLPQIISQNTSVKMILTQVAIWLVAGLAFGGIMKFVLGRIKNI